MSDPRNKWRTVKEVLTSNGEWFCIDINDALGQLWLYMNRKNVEWDSNTWSYPIDSDAAQRILEAAGV